MSRFVTYLVVGIAGTLFLTTVSADDSVKPPEMGRTTDHEADNEEPELPIRFPSAGTILRAVRDGKARFENEHVQCELVKYKVSGTRFYPLVGQARLVQSHFQCTVTSDPARKIVYIDESQLIPVR